MGQAQRLKGSKALKICWKHPEMFGNTILRLVTFHTICVLLSTIGLSFGSAGLGDIIIESNVIAEGPSDKVLSGKHYNRSVRFHKLMFEACVRLIWESFLEWNTDSGSSEVIFSQQPK